MVAALKENGIDMPKQGTKSSQGSWEWISSMTSICVLGVLLANLAASPLLKQDYEKARCAVIANSGDLLAVKLGSVIDSHDLVFRFNAGPTGGYEEHVGSFTDGQFLSQRTIDRIIQRNDTREGSFIFLRDRIRINQPDEIPRFAQFLSDKKRKFWMYEFSDAPGLEGVVHDPTTGILGLFMLSQMCEELNGFGFMTIDENAYYHYYPDENAAPSAKPRTQIQEFEHWSSRGKHQFWHEKAVLGGYIKSAESPPYIVSFDVEKMRNVKVSKLRLVSGPRVFTAASFKGRNKFIYHVVDKIQRNGWNF